LRKYKGVESKTTTVGIKLRDYVILAADKRATAGLYVAHKYVDKIIFIKDYAAITMSGLVADAQYLTEIAKYISSDMELSIGVRPSIRSIASYVSLLLSIYLRYIPFVVQAVLGGYDSAPRLYYIDMLGTLSEEDYAATGSGSPIAIGILEQYYDKNMELSEAKKLAVSAVKSAIERDAWTGTGVDVVTIGSKGVTKETILFSKVHAVKQ